MAILSPETTVMFYLKKDGLVDLSDRTFLNLLFPTHGTKVKGLTYFVSEGYRVSMRDESGYLGISMSTQNAAMEVASRYMVNTRKAVFEAIKLKRIEEGYRFMFENLQIGKPIAVYQAEDPKMVAWWQVFFHYELALCEILLEDSFTVMQRKQKQRGAVDGFGFRVDVGGNNDIIGLTATPIPELSLTAKGLSRLTAGFQEKVPHALFLRHSYSRHLIPVLVPNPAGPTPMVDLKQDDLDSQAPACNTFGIPISLLTGSDANFLPWNQTVFNPNPNPADGRLLRVIRDDIGFHSYDPGYIPTGKRPPADSFTYPSLALGELLEFIAQSESGWLKVIRILDKRTGYVDWRYVEQQQLAEHEAVVIQPLPKMSAIMIKDWIRLNVRSAPIKDSWIASFAKLFDPLDLRRHFPLTPRSKGMQGVDLESIILLLEFVFSHFPIEDLAFILVMMKEDDVLNQVLKTVRLADVEKHPQIILLMLLMLPPKQVFEVLSSLLSKEAMKRIVKIRSFLRVPTIQNKLPFDKDAIAGGLLNAFAKIVGKSEEKFMHLLDTNIDLFLRMRAFEFDYLFSSGDGNRIRSAVLEMDELANAGMELLFGKAGDTNLFEIATSPTMGNFWNYLKTERERPTIYLLKDGTKVFDHSKGEAPELGEIFCFKTNQLLTSLPTPVIKNLAGADLDTYNQGLIACKGGTQDVPAPNASSTTATGILKKEGKDMVRKGVILAGHRVKAFLHSDLFSYYAAQPEYMVEINKVVLESLRPAAAAKLNLDTADQKRFLGRNAVTADDISRNYRHIRDRLTWIDIARIWFYELGSENELGLKGVELAFSKDSTTTQDLRAHPASRAIHQYIRARALSGNHEEITLFVHYDVAGFWKAVQANDAAFNLLGSVTATIFPNASTSTYAIEVENALSLVSATRFDRDAKTGQIEGLISNRERNAVGGLELGGTLRCKWKWEEAL